MAKYSYECINTNCGNVEQTNNAPAATKRCPQCGAMMKRVET